MDTLTTHQNGHRIQDLRRRAASERGDTLVEFALASTLFLAIVFGTIEFGLAVYQNNMLSNLAQEGARRAIVCGQRTGLTRATDCNISDFVSSRALGIVVATTVTPPDLSLVVSGQTVTVVVSTQFTPLTRVFPHAALWTMQSTAQMVMSR